MTVFLQQGGQLKDMFGGAGAAAETGAEGAGRDGDDGDHDRGGEVSGAGAVGRV